MNPIVGVATGFGLGIMTAYLLDVDRGRRRRAIAIDKLVRAGHLMGDAADATARDVRNRSLGAVARLRSAFERNVDDDVLVERVRARIGGAVRHPRAIDVYAVDGTVTLRGLVLARDVKPLLRRVAATRGVRRVEHRLQVHEARGNIPSLQGEDGARRGGPRWDAMQEYWSPTTRLAAGLLGTGLTAYALRSPGLAGAAAGLSGLVLCGRAAANLPLRRLLGVGAGCRAVEVHKTITVDAPVQEVFDLWANYENFPRFMGHVRDVRRAGDGRAHWSLDGPGGVPIRFETVETRREPNRLLAWRTVEGAAVAHAGIVRFDPEGGGTRIDIRMSYNPPGGAVGHAVAAMLGRDPKRVMDEDLVRMKSLLEHGRTRARGGEETRRADVRSRNEP